MIRTSKEPITCDICGDKSTEYMPMTNTMGRKLYICRACSLKEDLIEETDEEVLSSIKLITPRDIVSELDKVVVGQAYAKKETALEVYTHLLRLLNKKKLLAMGKRMKKNNILITGMTGCGKSLLAGTIANIVNVPFATTICTTLTETGYSGEDVENVVVNLFNASGHNLKRCEKGIVFLDEVDKLAHISESNSNVKGINSTGVQKALLSIIEGCVCRMPPQGGRKHPNQKDMLEVNTEDILFIAGGAFQGIEFYIKNRILKTYNSNSIGFGVGGVKRKEYTLDQLRAMITINDLLDFGMVPEFLGRFPLLINMESLNESHLFSILKLENGILQEYKTYFNLLGKDLHFEDSAIRQIAKISSNSGFGARNLRSVLKTLLSDLMYDAPSNSNVSTYNISNKMVMEIL
jgi:ATP-dependent Clp protease ATP-binding subunit ClpX